MNILDTTENQTTIYVFVTPNVCFCTTWGKQNKQNITFIFNAISLFDYNSAHFAHFVQFLALCLTVYPIVQLCNC